MGLDVYLSEQRIGALTPTGGDGYSFAYAPELVERMGEGKPLLSRSLPLRAEPYGPEKTRAYVEGLLPEGERREQAALELCVDPDDGYALIAELGRDCPGAVVFLPEGEPLERRDPDSLAWLEEGELEDLLEVPPDQLFDPFDERRMRFALPGERHKLALVRDEEEDRWAWPEAGVPSTHIVKPEGDESEDFAVNEMACSLAMQEMGLPVAHVELEEIGGHPCLVSRRFDRWGAGPGAERLHQESFNQALGIPPDRDPDPLLDFIKWRELLEAVGEESNVKTLFEVAFCNYLIGNGNDVRGKNSALLYTGSGPLLAPFYDIASTAIYDSPRKLRSFVDWVHDNSCLVGMARIAIPCQLEFIPSTILATQTLVGLARALNGVADRAKREGWHSDVIERVLQRVFDRFHRLREEINGLRPPGADPI